MSYVDCDSHILPEDAFDEVAPEYRAQGPKLVTDESGVASSTRRASAVFRTMRAIFPIHSIRGRG